MVTATGIGRDFTEEGPAFRLISTYTGVEVTAYVEEAISGVAAGASTLSVVSGATMLHQQCLQPLQRRS